MTDQETYLELLKEFKFLSKFDDLEHEIVKKGSQFILIIYVSNPTERLYEMLEKARKLVTVEGGESPLATLKRRKAENLLDAPEGRLLLKVLSEIQNVNRYSFEEDFWSRYTRSVSGAETQVTATANHIVLGRRGAGKSMLLLYAWHTRRDIEKSSVWIDMQIYSNRDDREVVGDVLSEILEQLMGDVDNAADAVSLIRDLREPGVSETEIRKILPRIKRLIGSVARKRGDLFIFLDDFHVIGLQLQPFLLDVIYAVSRGNKVFIKLSAIESLIRTYDSSGNLGLEVPQDAQFIRLDYNLTTPEKTAAHIQSILDGHAQFSGLKSIRQLCTSTRVIPRLTWVAAGVPRDAISLFAQAMTKASTDQKKKVSVTNINIAASETLTTKLRDLDRDSSYNAIDLKLLVEQIREFCVTDKRKNAFLVEIGAKNPVYDEVLNLVHLRLLHIINEGITVGVAGRKYLALILDYGFYTGIRAAQSVDLFNRQSNQVTYKEIRSLPIFRGQLD